jgi:tRNA threonylcarbamoyladenosine biosynthesis protein TsaE
MSRHGDAHLATNNIRKINSSMFSQYTRTTNSEQETFELGTALAAALTAGIAIALNGQLGSGKTNLIRAVCDGLKIDTIQVNSPTFVLMQCYSDGRLPVAHFDTYRLADTDEFLAIGGEDYLLDPETVCFVEWAERIGDIFPADHLRIEIEQTGETSRQFNFFATGDRSQKILDGLRSYGVSQ